MCYYPYLLPLLSPPPPHYHPPFPGGLHHTLMLDDSGNVFAFGRVHYGRLGLGKDEEEEDIKTPQQIKGLEKV